MHVFGPQDQYPGISNPRYDYPGGSPKDYSAVAAKLGIERMVLVQSSFYGTDNRFLLETLKDAGAQARAVVFLPDGMDALQLEGLNRLGVRGIRLDFFKMRERGAHLDEYRQALRDACGLACTAGWHVELYSPGIVVRNLTRELAETTSCVSVNHMGYMTAEDGLEENDFRRFVDAVRSSLIWVKLTGPYRLSKGDSWRRAEDMALALIEAAPDRMLWGTDWPHIPECDLDTGSLLTALKNWCPEKALRHRILVSNPARLYDYPAT
jgi:2-pyrone-4,6-dicarboxylate lactonase